MPVTSVAATAACPATLPGSGFNDLGGLTIETVEAINCLKYYAITTGITSTAFNPNGDVLRWQMALFLTREAVDMGITLPSGVSQGFLDISGFDNPTQTAINQLRQLGITQGTSVTTFDPNGKVPRWQMALFLTRLLSKGGITLPSGVSQGFNDIGSFDAATQTAINQLRQLGVAFGTSSNSYSPNDLVLRWQMALFLARTLNAAGVVTPKVTLTATKTLAVTSETISLTMTVKNGDGSNAAGTRVDVFATNGLNANGTCTVDAEAHLTGTSADGATGTNCTIDNNDPITNATGQVTVTFSHDSTPEADIIYAWVSPNGTVFDSDIVFTKASLSLVWTAPPAALDVGAAPLAQFGTSTTVTAQFRDASGNPVALAGQSVRFVVTGSGSPAAVATTSDPTGKAMFTYLGPTDPSGGEDPVIAHSIKAFWDIDKDNTDDGAAELDETVTVNWDDATPRSDEAVLGPDNATGLVSTQRTVTATLTDKFGAPIPNVDVQFQITGALADTQVRAANPSGIATLTYTGPALSGATNVNARVDINHDGDFTDPEDLELTEVNGITHFWMMVAGDIVPGPTEFDLVAVSAAGNYLDAYEIGTGTYFRLNYDSGDNFFVNGASKTLAEFESAFGGLTLPSLDGPGLLELLTDPFDVGQTSTLRLITA